MAMTKIVDAAVWRLMVDPMLYHKIAYALTTMLWYWNFEYTCDTWFVCGNRRACAYGGTSSKIVCKPCSTPHTETVLPMNGCAYAAFDQIRLRTFFHIHRTDKHEHLCAGFEYVVANLMRQWIPGRKNIKKKRKLWSCHLVIHSLLLLFSLLNKEHVFHSNCVCFEISELESLDEFLFMGIDNCLRTNNLNWQPINPYCYGVTIFGKYFVVIAEFGAIFFCLTHDETILTKWKYVFFFHYYYYWMLRNEYSFCQTKQ